MSPGEQDTQLAAATASAPTSLPKLLSLTVHEFRSPLTVVSGYIRMLLKDRARPLPDQQRRILEEAEKSCARLSALLVEVSELSHLEAGTAPFNRSAVDILRLLREAAAELPGLPDRDVFVDVAGEPAHVHGDAVRLKGAFSSILRALRRELVSRDRVAVRVEHSRGTVTISIGEAAQIDRLQQAGPEDFATFDEWRGGNGLSLPTARRIIEAHGGRILGLRDDEKASATIMIPGLQT